MIYFYPVTALVVGFTISPFSLSRRLVVAVCFYRQNKFQWYNKMMLQVQISFFGLNGRNKDRNKSVCGKRVSNSQYQPFSICYVTVASLAESQNSRTEQCWRRWKKRHQFIEGLCDGEMSLIKSPLYFSLISFSSVVSFGPIFRHSDIYISRIPYI